MKKLFLLKNAGIMLAFIFISLSSSASIHIITVQNFSFNPSQIIDVIIGDTIRWTWVNGTHTTTSTTIPSGAATWDHPIDISNTSFEYIPVVAGTYNYKCTPHQSMGMTGTFTVISSTGITGQWKPPVITVYPNPFINQVNIHFTSDHSLLRNLKIFDITGKLWKDLYFTDNPVGVYGTLNFPDLPSGIYFFEFIDNQNNLSARRVLKQ